MYKSQIDTVLQKYLPAPFALDGRMQLAEELGMDSLKRVQLICDLEDTFGIEFAIEDLHPEHFKTVQDLYDMVAKYRDSFGA